MGSIPTSDSEFFPSFFHVFTLINRELQKKKNHHAADESSVDLQKELIMLYYVKIIIMLLVFHQILDI